MSLLLRRYAAVVAVSLVVAVASLTPIGVATSSAGAASSPPTSPLLAPGDHVETLTWGGLVRTYIVHVPTGVSTAGRPLVLVFHGATDTALSTLQGTDFEQAADQAGDIVVFMQGYDDTWNELTGRTPAAQAHVDDIGFTSAVMNALRASTNYDVKKVAAVGLSNGALLVETMGCHLASRLTLIVPVEGELASVISPRCSPSRPLSVLEIHGTADATIPYTGGKFVGVGGGTVKVLSAPNSVRRWATLDHCSSKAQTVNRPGFTLTRYSHCQSSVSVTLRTIIGGQHVWGSNIGSLVTAALGH